LNNRLKFKHIFDSILPQVFMPCASHKDDDVMTTGASLNELAKTLKQAGFAHVEY